MKRSLPGLVGLALLSGCSVEPAAKLFNGAGALVAIRVAAFEQGRAVGHEDLPVAPGRSVRLGAAQLQAAGLAVVAGGCVYAYRLTSDDLEDIKDRGGAKYPIPLEVGPDLSIRLRPSASPGALGPEAFGFPRKPISKTCTAT